MQPGRRTTASTLIRALRKWATPLMLNENEYAVASLKQKLAAVRKVEAAVAKRQRGAGSETSGSEVKAAKKIEGW